MFSKQLNIMVVDDSEDDIIITSHYLSRIDTFGITILKESNYNAARKKILQNDQDVYIVDYLLGPHTGLELIKECTLAGVVKPFILLTGKANKAIDIEATKEGVYDYLIKSELNTEQLERSLRYSLQRYSSYTTIAESERKYREIFTKSNDIIFVLDKDFRFLNFNPTMTRLMEFMPEELTNQLFSSLFENQEEAARFFYHMEFDETLRETEITLLTKTKRKKTFLSSFAKIVSPSGTVQYQGILHDYTNIKKSVVEQLLKEKAEATNKLVRSLAHEIRNPLTNIDLSVHQLEKDTTPDDRKVFTDIIKRNSKRINDLIGELMNLSNPGKNVYQMLELKEVLHNAISNAQDRILLKEIKITVNSNSDELYIRADKTKIEAAFLNIIINAVEAMEHGKGELAIETTSEDKHVVIKITDNGPGIEKENLPHLFQPYFTRKKNGIGLGLATTHSVINSHHGNIEVNSEMGKGTTFKVKLLIAES